MKLEEIVIEGFSKKGHGKASHGEKSLEVKGGVPGDRLLVEMLKRRKTELKEVLTPSPHRVVAKCPHAQECGGCAWQQVSYTKQLEEKQERLEKLFLDHLVNPIIGCDPTFNYRSKMEFSFSQDLAGNRYLGLMKPGSRGRVVNLQECHISRPWVAEMLKRMRTFWEESGLEAYHPRSDRGTLQTLTLRGAHYTNRKMVILTVSGNPEYAPERKQLNLFIKAAQLDEDTSVFLIVRHIAKGRPTRFYEMHLAGPDTFEEKLLGQSFHMSPQAFFQPNTLMAEKLFTKAIDLLQLKGTETVLDLYCGIGTIGLLLAKHVHQVIGVELSKEAICDARYNIEQQGLTNVQMFATDAGTFAKERGAEYKPDIVIVDPPRVGLDANTLHFLNTYQPQTILYISCNPTTQAENIKELKGYDVDSIHPVDQFPHTPHVENIILLKRV